MGKMKPRTYQLSAYTSDRGVKKGTMRLLFTLYLRGGGGFGELTITGKLLKSHLRGGISTFRGGGRNVQRYRDNRKDVTSLFAFISERGGLMGGSNREGEGL